MTTISIKPALNFLLAQKQHDLSIRQLSVLLECAAGSQTVRGLAACLNVSKPAITRAADKLVAKGWMQRKKDQTDGRSVILSLTRPGQKFATRFA